MNSSNNPSKIYWRQFFRSQDILFRDTLADDTFAAKNFVDFFGKVWLPSHADALSFDDVVRPFYEDSIVANSNTFFQVFAVSDGSVIQSTPENLPWLNQSIRFVAIVAGNDQNKPASPFDNNGSWTLCIVGSSALKSDVAFLQVASWDGNRFRYYGRESVNNEEETPLVWIFMGDSTDAFGQQSYMGPFNGHVNGSLVMKELHRPWIHWLAGGNNFTNHVSNQRLKQFDNVSYLSDAGTETDVNKIETDSLSKVAGADILEKHISAGIIKWFNNRRQANFVDPTTKQPVQEVKNVKRWLAHILLTTTVNMTAGRMNNSGEVGHNDFDFPEEHFYNADLFGSTAASGIQPSSDLKPLGFSQNAYDHALNAINLALVQRYPPSNRPQPDPATHPEAKNVVISGVTPESPPLKTFVAQWGEGENLRFQILQPSFEDVQGALTLLTQAKRKPPLLSTECIYAMLMVDPWNPIYSWRRGVLLQYVPDTTSLPGPYDKNANPPQKYDLEAIIEANVRDSPRYKNEVDSPEREFIANLEVQRNASAGGNSSNFSDRMTNYLFLVQQRLADPAASNDAVTDYMKLAESRRRIYRPVPLDEFDLTLPWATKYDYQVPFEMTSAGTIRPVAPRGVKFLNEWIGSLADISNPQMIPRPDKDDPPENWLVSPLPPPQPLMFSMSAATNIPTRDDDNNESRAVARMATLKGISANLSCKPSADHRHFRSGGCPVLSRRARDAQL